jgi:hypothetical protein
MAVSPRDLRLALRAKQAGARYSLRIIWEARRAGIPASLGFALVQTESGFRNIFGHDPTHSIPDSWKGGRVTKDRYLYYKSRRKAGFGMQGVGPCQLTWYATQDRADQMGGCWKITYNIRVGFQNLAANIQAFGYAKGIERYNGSGPAAQRYSQIVQERAQHWHRCLT